jgi:hypothetical protein
MIGAGGVEILTIWLNILSTLIMLKILRRRGPAQYN